jgi:hypothetical protein
MRLAPVAACSAAAVLALIGGNLAHAQPPSPCRVW